MGCNSLAAQKEDNTWLLGKRIAENKPDTGINTEFGLTKLIHTPYNVSRQISSYGFELTNTSISDKDGNLLFYTNGTKILNRNYQIMQNGDSINAGYIQYEWDTTMKKDGYRTMQGAIILPLPENDSLYYVLHLLKDSSRDNSIQLYDSKLLHTLVNIKANNGLGKVIYKDSLLIKDTFSFFISACKKANGKDWWIFALDANTEYLHKLSLTKSGLKAEGREKLARVNKLDLYQARFSPNGKKFILFNAQFGLSVYDFDRCGGNFSNPKFCPIPELVDSFWTVFDVSVSSNSQFLYATLTKRIYQFDFNFSNLNASKILVAEYDGFYDNLSPFRTLFSSSMLAPNDKIYIHTGNTTRYLHIIDKPNEKGLACNVIQHGLKLPTWNRSIPYFPHYRMSADSSSCTSGIDDDMKMDIQVYPNPASDYIIVSSPSSIVNKVELHNQLGQKTISFVDNSNQGYRIDVRDLSEGIYIIFLLDKSGSVLKSEKLVIVR
ncbi:MAG: T9SS type A sorting domain-containing protein [Sphingobacteriales bacterium]|jgi:hypothetical protein|nr:T9SS type A sorting domain-containing protein [Sphingobacteriales bacterium]